MFARPLLFGSMLAASMGLPYLSSTATQMFHSSEGVFGLKLDSSASSPATTAVEATGEKKEAQNPIKLAERSRRPDSEAPLEGFQVHRLGEVLRFDVTPQWVYDHWSRKTTALSDLDLYGVRVPLVTGTRVSDLAGSLTYYFDHLGKVQRINFVGRTGDPSQLISLLTKNYHFRAQVPELPGEQLYDVRWNGRPTSQLLVRPAPVIWASAPHATFQVELEMNCPGSARFVRPRNRPVALPTPSDEANSFGILHGQLRIEWRYCVEVLRERARATFSRFA